MSGSSLGEAIEAVSGMAELPPTDGPDILPVVKWGNDISMVAQRLGSICTRLPIYRRRDAIVTFDGDGEERHMTGRRFRSWVNEHVIIARKFHEETGKALPSTMKVEDAATVLESEPFLRSVRKIRRIARVRMPVIRTDGEGKKRVELLPEGYDAEYETLTLPGPKIDETWTLGQAQDWFEETFGCFPFAKDRDRAVHIAAMLAVWCRMMLSRMALRPGVLYLANKPGSGKSVLAKSALYTTFPMVASAKMKEGEQLDKELEAFSRNGVPYVFLDNLYGNLASASLDQILTSVFSMGRSMGGHEVFVSENTFQIFATGNNLTMNDDAVRRFLVCDLFEEGEPSDRKFGARLDDSSMSSDEWRSRALSALWAMVREWDRQGMPGGKKSLPTYEEFSGLIGGIAWAAGFEDPFEPPEAAAVISPEKAEFYTFLRAVVKEMREMKEGAGVTTHDFTLEEMARIARAEELYVHRIGTADDGKQMAIRKHGVKGAEAAMVDDEGILDQKQRIKWVHSLKPHAGTKPTVDGVQIEFGKRTQSRKTFFTVTILE